MAQLSFSRKELAGDDDLQTVIKHISETKNLMAITLRYFHDHEIKQLLLALHHCLELESLDLSRNMTEDTEIPVLIKLLENLPKVNKINLSHSFISERGIIALVNACKPRNIDFDISYNRMSHERTPIYQSSFSPPSLMLREDNRLLHIQQQLGLNPRNLLINVPNYQQDYDYDCGASTVLNINDYFNRVTNKTHLSASLQEVVQAIKTCSMNGAEIEHMLAWFATHQYEASGGFNGTEELLRYYTGIGIPVIINTNEWGGHYIVVIGFEAFDPIWPEKDKLLVSDPLDYQQGDFNPLENFAKRNLLQFLDQWRDSQGRHGGYIVALPSQLAKAYPDWRFE